MDAVCRNGGDCSMDDMARVGGVSKPVCRALQRIRRQARRGRRHRHQPLQAAGAGGCRRPRRPASHHLILVRASIGGLVDIIDTEPELYQFVVRSIRSGDRGLLDNALVQVVQERLAVLMGLLLPGLDVKRLRALSDGLFGFGFAAVESWTSHRELTKDELVDALSSVVQAGIEAAATLRPGQTP